MTRLRPRAHPALAALACLGVGAGACLGAGAASAQGLVILAQGAATTTHPVGSMLRPGAVLALGDRVDVLERGGTRRLDGPTVYVPLQRSTAAENVRGVVTQLMDRRRDAPPDASKRPPIMVRGFSDEAARADAALRAEARARYAGGVWTVDAARAGVTCFRLDEPPRVWRPADPAPLELSLAGADGAGATPVRWAAGVEAVAWPGSLPAAPRDYVLRAGDGQTRVRLVPIAASSSATLDDLVVALDRAGCGAQRDYLLDQYPDASAPPR